MFYKELLCTEDHYVEVPFPQHVHEGVAGLDTLSEYEVNMFEIAGRNFSVFLLTFGLLIVVCAIIVSFYNFTIGSVLGPLGLMLIFFAGDSSG